MQKRLSKNEYIDGILKGDRVILSRAITLIESQLSADRVLSQEVLEAILPHSGNSLRIGITGVPGVGKSTFIETFGKFLTSQQKKIAVLTVDPSSQITKGSILGDKTRMDELSNDPLAYIRPSPAGNSLGGVAYKTRESILLCEAAGFEIIIVETVGVGQSETYIHGMVDFFLLLMLGGAGDELQGIKRGIMEMADGIVITKSDSGNETKANLAKVEYENALHLYPKSASGWYAEVLLCSALEKTGIQETWNLIQKHQQQLTENGFFQQNRKRQTLDWMFQFIRQTLEENFYQKTNVANKLDSIKQAVESGKILPIQGALKLLLEN
jgi:LAO/AO transport system kinase